MAIFTTIFNFLWLIALLVLLFLIWRRGVKQTDVTMKALIDVSKRSVESAYEAVEVAHKAVNIAKEAIEELKKH